MASLTALVLAPAVAALLVLLARDPRWVLSLCAAGSLSIAVLAAALALPVPSTPIFALGGYLFMDALSAYNTLIVVAVFAASSIYARSYFRPAIDNGSFDDRKAHRFGLLWFLFLESMLVTLVANNIGLMWVGMEATTVVSALLVCLDRDATSVRAAWTYLLMCSVAIALALLGVLVVSAEAQAAAPGPGPSLWTELVELAPRMRPGPLRLAFLFALVGYGTKAGLAPLHSWLPEAHGQAPTPVSAVLSGVLLNCALYSLCRFLPLVEPTSPGWTSGLLILFGLVSISVAAAFIIHEGDIKRLLAFHSVEHMGIITLGLGVGAHAAALFHTLNHSVSKMLTFFCAGVLAQRFGSRDMDKMSKTIHAEPAAGIGFFLGLLALIGLPPFSIFMSELWIARVGVGHGHIAAVVVFLAGAAVVFIAAFRHAIEMTWSRPGAFPALGKTKGISWPLVVVPLIFLVVAGVWMPEAFMQALVAAASVLGVQP